jgi:hypothetical protein
VEICSPLSFSSLSPSQPEEHTTSATGNKCLGTLKEN